MTKQEFDFFSDRIGFPPEHRSALFPIIERIDSEYTSEYSAINADRTAIGGYHALADKLGEEKDIVMLAVCFLLARDAKPRYDAAGASDEIYFDSMRELTIWSARCLAERGHIGIYGHDWLNNFFDPHLFRIGRLEFEEHKFAAEQPYSAHGVTLKKGDRVINVHIPEDGPLNHDDVLESYKAAYKFFSLSGNAPFVCETWLLWPGNLDFLPPKSNIRSFMEDYDIVFSTEEKNSRDLWRVFGRRESYNPSELPRDNSLRKNLAEYLEEHDCVTGHGYGVIIHNGDTIVNKSK